jgi:hypothetical protein
MMNFSLENLNEIIDDVLLEFCVTYPIPDFQNEEQLLHLKSILEQFGVTILDDTQLMEAISLAPKKFTLEAPVKNKAVNPKDKVRVDAHKKGLEGKGGNAYGPKGKDLISHRNQNGKLVAVNPPVKIGKAAQQQKQVGKPTQKPVVKPTQKPVVKATQPTNKLKTKLPQQTKAQPKGTPAQLKRLQQLQKAVDLKRAKEKTTSSNTVTKSGKNKTLAKIDSLNSKNFLLKQNPDDATFDKINKKSQIGPPPKPFKFAKEIYQNAKVPKRHLIALERMLRTKLTDTSKKWSHFSDLPGGAGKIPAQAGELMTLIGTTLDDKSAAIFYNSLAKYENEQTTSHPDLQSPSKRIVTKDWIAAAMNNRKAIKARINKEYPGATIIAGSWDTEDEVTSLGLSDYKKNKGFSTDAYFKLKLKDGKVILDEVSLKKDKNVNFLNSGTGEFLKWDPNIPDDINPKVYAATERKALMTFAKKNLQKLANIAKTDKELQLLIKDKGFDVKSAYQMMIDGTGKARDVNNVVYTAIKALAAKGNVDAKKYVSAVDKTHKKYIANSVSALSTNKKLKQGMLNSIREEFPLKAVGEGEESMAIGDMSLDRAVLRQIFGTNDFEQIKEGLIAVTDAEPPYIAYRAKSSKVNIPIAQIGIREDGVGYGGQLKFEMKLDPRFAKVLKDANNKIYGAK